MDRREFLKGALLGVGTALVGASKAPAVTIDDTKVTALDLRITCTTELLRQPSGKTVKLWVPGVSTQVCLTPLDLSHSTSF